MDLAGSEALSAAQERIQQVEGMHIRDSLTALKTFLHQHAQGNPGSSEKKLTHFMKMIMGRGAKLLVIANISPNAEFFSQTKDALEFVSGIAKLKTLGKSKAEVGKTGVKGKIGKPWLTKKRYDPSKVNLQFFQNNDHLLAEEDENNSA
jgi:hypothetical protein